MLNRYRNQLTVLSRELRKEFKSVKKTSVRHNYGLLGDPVHTRIITFNPNLAAKIVSYELSVNQPQTSNPKQNGSYFITLFTSYINVRKVFWIQLTFIIYITFRRCTTIKNTIGNNITTRNAFSSSFYIVKKKETTMLWILIVLMLAMLGVGIFALRGAIKNSFKDVALRNPKARRARNLLGEEGYRYFVGILGVLFILAPFVLMVGIFGESFRSGGSKTDLITISIVSDDPTITSSLRATEDQLKMKYDLLGDREFDTYQHISLKNNYRSTLPDIIWKMKNLESIDLTHNTFKELPLDEFGKLPKLKQLILDGNPIEPAYLEKVRSELNEIQVTKNDVMTP